MRKSSFPLVGRCARHRVLIPDVLGARIRMPFHYWARGTGVLTGIVGARDIRRQPAYDMQGCATGLRGISNIDFEGVTSYTV
jgi:hypothetical protein